MKKVKTSKILSDFELLNIATKYASETLEKHDIRIDNYFISTSWSIIYFTKSNGKSAWVVVKYGINKTKETIKAPDMTKKQCYPLHADGYFAPIVFEYEGNKPYKDKTILKLPGAMIKIYDGKTHKFL